MVIDVWPPGRRRDRWSRLTNPDKVLYPSTGTTKADVFRYYTTIAEAMVPHIAAGRQPVSAGRTASRRRRLLRKELAKSAPAWIAPRSPGAQIGETTYPIIDDSIGLAWIAQQAAWKSMCRNGFFDAKGRPGRPTAWCSTSIRVRASP